MYSAAISDILTPGTATYLDIVHLQDLLLVSSLRLLFTMVKRRLHLLPLVFDLLTRPVIFSLHLLQVTVRSVPFLLQLRVEIDMTFPYLVVLNSRMFQGLRNLDKQIVGKFVPFPRMRLNSRQLCTPCSQRCGLERSGRHRRSISDTELADLLRLAVGVFLA